jgi:hypothetical protein
VENIEPFYNWRDYYASEEDERSPFFRQVYNEFYYDKTIYNYLIHPQWDDFGSDTLYLKILFVDYVKSFTVIEFIGEWNDCITNDIMLLKREVVDVLLNNGINHFILIGENVLNFHYDSDDYYEEWLDDIEEGWIAFINLQEHVLRELQQFNLKQYVLIGQELNHINWRTFKPEQFFEHVNGLVHNEPYYLSD